MADALSGLEEITRDVTILIDAVEALRTTMIQSDVVQPTAGKIARVYFEHVRPELSDVQDRRDLVATIDAEFQKLLEHSSQSQAKTSYQQQLPQLRTLLLAAAVDIMRTRGERRLVLSETERGILAALSRILPETAASYEQALRDFQLGNRASWRGPALEMREVLREVIDHFAPDAEVMGEAGFALEERQRGPTQKQKVRYILRSRRSGSAAAGQADTALDAVDEAVAALARTTYVRGSASAHRSTGVREFRNLKRYVDAMLGELLEIVEIE